MAKTSCSAGQLKVGDLGSDGAAGTGILTIRVENVSTTPCWLKGWPTLAFVRPSGAIVATTVSHSGGPGAAFAKPEPVKLTPGRNPTAGFVVLSRDIPTDDNACHDVSAILVSLPNVRGSFNATSFRPLVDYNLCNPGNPVSISAIVKAPLIAGYAPANLGNKMTGPSVWVSWRPGARST